MTATSPDASALADRYGRTPRPRRARVLVAVAAVAVLALTAWIVAGLLRDPVQWTHLGYEVVDATTVEVTFTVTKDPDATARCEVRALSESFTEVGYRTVEVGPAEQRTQSLTVAVTTVAPAVTGNLVGCELARG